GCVTTACTFEPMPAEYFAPHDPPARLTRFRERFEQLRDCGVDELFCPRFESVRGLTPEDFVKALLVQGLAARHVVVGDDFRFGVGRSGTVATLRAEGERWGF